MTADNFGFDSGEYELLTEAVSLAKDVDGMCLEIGLRFGRGMATIVEAVAQHSPQKVCISLDPYGSLLYHGREGHICRLDYDEQMRNACLSQMYVFVNEKQVHWKFIELSDADFYVQNKNGVIVYDLEKKILNTYSLIHFDGPHNIKDLKDEFNFFYPRMTIGAIGVWDDVTPDFFDVNELQKHMGDKMELVIMGAKKGLWRKVK